MLKGAFILPSLPSFFSFLPLAPPKSSWPPPAAAQPHKTTTKQPQPFFLTSLVRLPSRTTSHPLFSSSTTRIAAAGCYPPTATTAARQGPTVCAPPASSWSGPIFSRFWAFPPPPQGSFSSSPIWFLLVSIEIYKVCEESVELCMIVIESCYEWELDWWFECTYELGFWNMNEKCWTCIIFIESFCG